MFVGVVCVFVCVREWGESEYPESDYCMEMYIFWEEAARIKSLEGLICVRVGERERERARFLRSRLLYEDVYVWQGDCEDEVSWMSKLCVSMCICMYVCT